MIVTPLLQNDPFLRERVRKTLKWGPLIRKVCIFNPVYAHPILKRTYTVWLWLFLCTVARPSPNQIPGYYNEVCNAFSPATYACFRCFIQWEIIIYISCVEVMLQRRYSRWHEHTPLHPFHSQSSVLREGRVSIGDTIRHLFTLFKKNIICACTITSLCIPACAQRRRQKNCGAGSCWGAKESGL
jgi:hypothetical protein